MLCLILSSSFAKFENNQFENKIDEVDLESFYVYRGDNTIENFIVSLIDIQEKS